MGAIVLRVPAQSMLSHGSTNSSFLSDRMTSVSSHCHFLDQMYDLARKPCLMWIHHLHCAMGTQSGSSHSSGGTGFTLSHLATPCMASQNFPLCGACVAPPSLCG